MKNSKYIFSLAALVFGILFTGCMKDAPDGQLCPDNSQGTTISLSMGDMQVVETRSLASSNENTISDAYLLVFGSNGKYKSGEKVLPAAITDNGQQKPTLTTELGIAAGDKIVVLCNTGVAAMPTFAVGTSTTADINAAFTSAGWSLNRSGAVSGQGMPMSGTIDSWTNGAECTMYRSVAKIQLLLDITGGDITSSFTTAADAVCWGLYNEVQQGNIYSTEYTVSTPSAVTFADDNALSQRVVGAAGATAEQQTRYTPEYPGSKKAKTTDVAASAFHKDRTCLIVHTSAGYYRIDLATGNGNEETKTFLDINRNYHYKVTITKVKSRGYETAAEALANPGSNLEYVVVITGDKDNSTTSNGQYAVTTDKKEAVVFSDVTAAEDLVWFRCETNGVANVTTRKIRLVGADKNTVISTTQLQMCKSDGTAIAGNVLNPYTSADEAGYQLKYTVPDDTLLPDEQVYVEITYGNIRHYVPVVVEYPDGDEPNVGDMRNTVDPAGLTGGDGWVALDGRDISTLTPSQQVAAHKVFGDSATALPDMAGKYAASAGSMGVNTGAATTMLTKANMPNISWTGTLLSAGAHTHTVAYNSDRFTTDHAANQYVRTGGTTRGAGNSTTTNSMSTWAGAHTHSCKLVVNSGTQTTIPRDPAYITVFTLVYLGN